MRARIPDSPKQSVPGSRASWNDGIEPCHFLEILDNPFSLQSQSHSRCRPRHGPAMTSGQAWRRKAPEASRGHRGHGTGSRAHQGSNRLVPRSWRLHGYRLRLSRDSVLRLVGLVGWLRCGIARSACPRSLVPHAAIRCGHPNQQRDLELRCLATWTRDGAARAQMMAKVRQRPETKYEDWCWSLILPN